MATQVNMLEAKSQLSKLVKRALAGEEVLIASNGMPVVKLTPIAHQPRRTGWGALKAHRDQIDAAFTPEVDREVGRLFYGE